MTKIKNNLKETAEIASLVFVSLVYTPINFCSNFLSKKIEDEKHLEMMLKEEASKLQLDDKNIKARFGAAFFETAYCKRLFGENYEIVLDERFRTKVVLRHELYHIYKGDVGKKDTSLFRRIFLEEPRAILYQTLGIKL